jgi:hypothetical protein
LAGWLEDLHHGMADAEAEVLAGGSNGAGAEAHGPDHSGADYDAHPALPVAAADVQAGDAGGQQGPEVRARFRGAVQGERAQIFQRPAKVRVLFEPGILEDRLDIPFFPACGRDTHDGV